MYVFTAQVPPGTTEALNALGELSQFQLIILVVIIVLVVLLIGAVSFMYSRRGQTSLDQSAAKLIEEQSDTIKEERIAAREERAAARAALDKLGTSFDERLGQLAKNQSMTTDVLVDMQTDGSAVAKGLVELNKRVGEFTPTFQEVHKITRTEINTHTDGLAKQVLDALSVIEKAIQQNNPVEAVTEIRDSIFRIEMALKARKESTDEIQVSNSVIITGTGKLPPDAYTNGNGTGDDTKPVPDGTTGEPASD